MYTVKRYNANSPARTSWDLFREFDDLFTQLHGGESREKQMNLATDIRENDKGYLLAFDVPGMTDADIKIEVKDGMLSISGERKVKSSEQDENGWTRRERSFGSFTRSFTLPTDVDTTNIEAQVENGELHLFLPKGEQARPKTIPVRRSSGAETGEVKGLMERFFSSKEKEVGAEKH